jgi:hypothetical protein
VKNLFLIALAILLAGLVVVGLIDTVISIPNTSASVSEVTGSISKVSNSSASATITFMTYPVDDE